MHASLAALNLAGVRRVVTEDVPTISRMLAETFVATPFHRWAYADLAQDELIQHFTAHVSAAIARDGAFATPGLEAVALWDAAPPPRPSSVDRDMADARYRAAINEILRHRPATPHLYLDVLATDRRHRGRGYARTLLDPMLAECDSTRQLVYLETDLDINVELYRRFGFAVTGTIALPHGGPSLYKMLRQPTKHHA